MRNNQVIRGNITVYVENAEMEKNRNNIPFPMITTVLLFTIPKSILPSIPQVKARDGPSTFKFAHQPSTNKECFG